MTTLLNWRALAPDGTLLERRQFAETKTVPPTALREMLVQTDEGVLRAVICPELGEQIRVFTRRQLAVAANGAPAGEPVGTVVIEITPDPDRPDRFVRLYVGREVVLSTEDLYG